MKKILVIVDMQNDFVDKTVLGNEECNAVIPKIVEKIEKGDYTHIIFTQDTHNETYMDTQEGKNLPVPHCLIGTIGHCIVEDIRNAAQKQMKPMLFLNKNTFGSRKLAENMFNVLEEVTVNKYPVIQRIKDTMINNKALGAMMSGSGPTVFGLYENREDVEYVAKCVSNKEIEENDYNLSVSTYVEQEDTREHIDIDVLNKEIDEIVEREQVLRDEIKKIISEIEV